MFYECGMAKRKIYFLDKELEGIRKEVYRKTEYETEFIQRNLSTEQLFCWMREKFGKHFGLKCGKVLRRIAITVSFIGCRMN